MILFRPTGLRELQLVAVSGWSEWPPRRLDQPVFYPDHTQADAEKITRDWDSVLPVPDNPGFVTRFEISAKTAARNPRQIAGGRDHQDLWMPAEELTQFNTEILGPAEVIPAYRDGSPCSLSEALPLAEPA